MREESSREICEKIAVNAIKGKNFEPTGGATFFYSGNKVRKKMKPLIVKLEGINFLKIFVLINCLVFILFFFIWKLL